MVVSREERLIHSARLGGGGVPDLAPSVGDVPVWDGEKWTPGAGGGGGISSGDWFGVGSQTNIAAATAATVVTDLIATQNDMPGWTAGGPYVAAGTGADQFTLPSEGLWVVGLYFQPNNNVPGQKASLAVNESASWHPVIGSGQVLAGELLETSGAYFYSEGEDLSVTVDNGAGLDLAVGLFFRKVS